MPDIISPAHAHALLQKGALLIDIREPGEFAGESIPGSENMPLSSIATRKVEAGGKEVVFLCKSGARTQMNMAVLGKVGGQQSHIMQGGIMAWKSAGFATQSSAAPRKGLFGLFG
ncbi:MAG: hypothetical protein KGO53_13925 [Alphaproteobacteria bacterium]|nr:hypothetical protein [Alphaproteobacteria bacterium]